MLEGRLIKERVRTYPLGFGEYPPRITVAPRPTLAERVARHEIVRTFNGYYSMRSFA